MREKENFTVVYILKCERKDQCERKSKEQDERKDSYREEEWKEEKHSRQPSNFSSPFDHFSSQKQKQEKCGRLHSTVIRTIYDETYVIQWDNSTLQSIIYRAISSYPDVTDLLCYKLYTPFCIVYTFNWRTRSY